MEKPRQAAEHVSVKRVSLPVRLYPDDFPRAKERPAQPGLCCWAEKGVFHTPCLCSNIDKVCRVILALQTLLLSFPTLELAPDCCL